MIAGGKRSCDADFVPPRPGDAVTLFITGEGVPAQPLTILFADVPAKACAESFMSRVHPGVTQVNVCFPEGVTWTPAMQVSAGTGARLVWSDEFNGPAGAPLDRSKWAYDLGGGGWGNQELETYTNSPENVFQDGNGHAILRALRAASGYTSARIKTQGKFDAQYGRIEARIKIPYGQGIWPAFWMLGNDIGTVGWPACGEIDIMENIGREPGTVHGTVHGPGYSGGGAIGRAFSLAAGKQFADDFHVYGVEWSPQSVEFFADGSKYFEVTPASLPAGRTWAYQHPFFLLLNVAVGGTWPGNPDATTTFPQEMQVDWVRVWQL
jgi:beta-glucanase (GH16 family)